MSTGAAVGIWAVVVFLGLVAAICVVMTLAGEW